MKILKKALLFLICISVSSCTIFNSTKSKIKLEGIAETSDQDIVTSLTRSYSDSAFFGLTFTRGNNLQYIVNYDETKGILFHIYPFSGSSIRYPLRVGDYDNLYECESLGRFIIKSDIVFVDILFSNDLVSTRYEYFFDISQVENGHIVQICTLIIYPYEKYNDSSNSYKWNVETIGKYCFPKINGEYQNITEEMTKNYFLKTKKHATGKYAIN